MKLFKSQKNTAEKKQELEQYPKVKTFSKAYGYSPAREKVSDGPAFYSAPFYPDEKPYPMTDIPADAPEYVPSADSDDPERIDLQDTLLTDASFSARAGSSGSLSRTDREGGQDISVPGPETFSSPEEPGEDEFYRPAEDDGPAWPEEFAGSAETEKAEDPDWSDNQEPSDAAGVFSWDSDPEEDDSEEDDPEPFFSSGSETGNEEEPLMQWNDDGDDESEPSFFSDSGAEDEQDLDLWADADSLSASEGGNAPDERPETESGENTETGSGSDPEPFSWYDSDSELSGDSDRLKFKKKKYTVTVGEKINLAKKLRSKPESSLKWKSSDKKVARISKKGNLTPRKKGKVTVRVKAKGGKRAKVKIRIKSGKKQRLMSWESVGAGKKASYDKKWSYFA